MSHIETALAIMKLVCTKDIHSNVEFSYLCLLISLPSCIYTPTVRSCIYTLSHLIFSFVSPISACKLEGETIMKSEGTASTTANTGIKRKTKGKEKVEECTTKPHETPNQAIENRYPMLLTN